MRLVFMGSPDFSVPILQELMAAGHQIVRVYAQPPRPAGRGKALRPCAVHVAANAAGLDVETPERFRDAVEDFAALDLDAAVVVAYGQILPQGALDAPRLGCLNLHASLLPRWRGAAPIQRAIMAGDTETGVGVMQMEAGLDTGPVLAEARTPIGPEDTAATLHDRLAAIGAPLMVDTLARLAAGDVKPVPQADSSVTYASKIDKAEARVNWSRPAVEIDRMIRGLSPFPGAWCEFAGQRVKLLMSQVEAGQGAPGEVLDDRLLISCSTGAIRLTRLQRAGKAAADAATFLQGCRIAKGDRLT
ncbi:MAG: methionyl-tRNA formyltransferase [Pseudomonadota bacterium]